MSPVMVLAMVSLMHCIIASGESWTEYKYGDGFQSLSAVALWLVVCEYILMGTMDDIKDDPQISHLSV